MDFQDLIEALLAAQKQKGLHTKAPFNFNTATLLTQPGGLFGVAGMDRTVISTHISPMGLGAYLPVFASNVDDPRYGVITGFGAAYGDEAVYPCDDAPKGYMKSGTLTALFGRIMRQTETIEIDKLLHEQRGASTNLQLLNDSLTGSGIIGQNMSVADVMNLVVKSEMVNVGVQLERKLATMLWSGTPSANTAGGGYKEFPGLDSQIATGHMDAETGVLMPSVDSLIMDFNYNDADGIALDIVEYLSYMEFYLRDLAERTRLGPASFALVMRPELWFELTAVWPCRYMTDRCSNLSGTNVVAINDDGNVRMRDDMRNGMYIPINGRNIPVITDDGIYEHNSTNSGDVGAGEFASSIYFVPLRVRGNFPVTYWEHIDYRQVGAQLSALGQGMRNVPFWTENGRLLWVYRDNSYCFDLQAKIEPRAILRTPHLAAKLQNVKYSPLGHIRSSDPANPYWVNGGVSTRSFTAGQAVWR